MKPYPAYKDSGVEWLGEIPKGWEAKRVRQVVQIQTGDGDTQDADESGSYPFYVRSPHVETIDRYTYDTEAVLTAGDGAGVGKIFHHVRGKFAAHQRVYVLSNFSGMHGRYFFYYFSTMFGLVALDGSAKSTVESVRRPMIADLAITSPPLEDQVAIAAYLDREMARIDGLIGEQEALVASLSERRAAMVSHAVTVGLDPNVVTRESGVQWLGSVPAHWDVLAVKRLSQVKRGASPRPIDDPVYFDDEGYWSWARISDVTASGGALHKTVQRLSRLGSSLSVRLEPGSLFLSIAGSVGKPCITEIPACIHDGFVYFPDLNAHSAWLYRVFESGHCFSGLGKLGTQLNLNTETVGGIQVAIPPPGEESETLRHLDQQTSKIDSLTTECRELITLLKERRTALISAAVTGKIDVRTA